MCKDNGSEKNQNPDTEKEHATAVEQSPLDHSPAVAILKDKIPQVPTVQLPTEVSTESKVNDANKKVNDANKEVLNAFIKTIGDEEKQRLKRQKPLIYFILIVLVLQLAAFNVLMFILVIMGMQNIEKIMFDELLGFLRYYVGAVIVELLSLTILIAKNTFSSTSDKILKKVLKNWNSSI